MKKISLILMLSFLLICVISCKSDILGTTEVVSTVDTTELVSKDSITTETVTTETTEFEKKEDCFSYPLSNKFIETPSRIVFPHTSIMNYYSKTTGEAYLLCFDPLCNHSYDCLSMSFYQTGLIESENFGYCVYNQRLYFLRGENLFSLGIDGSDLRNELSYGDSGKYFGKEGLMYVKFRALQYLSIYDKFVVFLHENPESGILELMAYDVTNSQLTNISEEQEINTYSFMQYVMCGNRIVFSILKDKLYEIYSYDLNDKNCKQIPTNGGLIDMKLFDGNYIYGVSSSVINDKRVSSILRVDIDNGECSTILNCDTRRIVLIAVSSEYVYFVPEDVVLLTQFSDQGEYQSSFSKLSRLSKTDGSVQLINSDTRYDIESVFFFEDKVLMSNYDQGPAAPNGTNHRLFIANVDENGNIVDITPFGVE